MNPLIDELSGAVLKKPLQDCSIEELQRLTEEYPYFGPGQLLLAKKIAASQTDNSPVYKEQVQRTSLYFQNRVWLDHLLKDSYNDSIISNDTVIAREETSPSEERYISADATNAETEEQPVTAQLPAEEIVEQKGAIEDVPAIARHYEETSMENHREPEPAIVQTTELTPEPGQTEMPDLKIETEPINKDLLFEPYHTVDYFASQGIKYKEEEKPRDRFSAQLKSFTEWLKTLKRVPAAEIGAASDPRAEKKVEQMAEYSIAERDVITEAMAEVWQKQGNKAKAEEIYNKLSLLDPSKSSYFAAKIEELKKSS